MVAVANLGNCCVLGKYSDAGAVLIVDPSVEMECDLVRKLLERGLTLFCVSDGATALRLMSGIRYDFAIVELRINLGRAFEVIESLARRQPWCRIVVSSDYCDLRTAVCAAKRGALDVLPKSESVEFLVGLLLGDDFEQLTEDGHFKAPKLIRQAHICSVYASSDFNISNAARRLSMHRRTLQRYLQQHGLLRPKENGSDHCAVPGPSEFRGSVTPQCYRGILH